MLASCLLKDILREWIALIGFGKYLPSYVVHVSGTWITWRISYSDTETKTPKSTSLCLQKPMTHKYFCSQRPLGSVSALKIPILYNILLKRLMIFIMFILLVATLYIDTQLTPNNKYYVVLRVLWIHTKLTFVLYVSLLVPQTMQRI